MENPTLLKIEKMRKKAFSVIELSIVIVVIGLIIALVTQSSKLVPKMKLAMARNATAAAPIPLMKDVVMWLETTSSKSFIDREADDGLAVSTWYDINPIDGSKNNATQTTSINEPTYVVNCINNLPCLRFNGASSYFNFDGSILAQTDYTIIIVEQRRSSANENYFFGGTGETANTNLFIGYKTDTQITFAQYDNDSEAAVAAYSASSIAPVIHAFIFDDDSGRNYYRNGTALELVSDPDITTPLSSYAGAKIGFFSVNDSYYNGDLAEIIILNRAINSDERMAIESYLSKKWKIPLS